MANYLKTIAEIEHLVGKEGLNKLQKIAQLKNKPLTEEELNKLAENFVGDSEYPKSKN